jgi:hypothetical protein
MKILVMIVNEFTTEFPPLLHSKKFIMVYTQISACKPTFHSAKLRIKTGIQADQPEY